MEEFKLLGPYLGSGGHRIVFKHKTNPNWVVKIAKDNLNHNNAEYETWLAAKEINEDEWLVPCVEVLDDGKYLIQELGDDILETEIPTNIPSWLKYDYNAARQWKLHNGKIKKCDYAHNESNALYEHIKQKKG